MDLGERFDESFSRNVDRAYLSQFISPKILDAGRSREPGDRGATTELRSVDDTHLELITRIDSEVTNRLMLEAEFEKDTGTTVLHHGRSTAHLAATGHLAATVRIWHAADGRLYAHLTGHFMGEMMLVPIVSSTEMWGRWIAATPATR